MFPTLGNTHHLKDMVGNTYHYGYVFPRSGTHVTRDMCFPGGGTHITRDMCFPGGGTHITRDMCFLGRENISLGICVSQVGNTYH